MSHVIEFAATCPRCKREQLQESFTLADLMGLLYGGSPIKAYCSSCDGFWTVNVQKRVELGELVAARCGASTLGALTAGAR